MVVRARIVVRAVAAGMERRTAGGAVVVEAHALPRRQSDPRAAGEALHAATVREARGPVKRAAVRVARRARW
jgi:hypothetical protein